MTRPLIVLGLNAHHADAAAALVIDGRVVAAAEEERFARVKHWAGFPARAVRFCLDAAGVDLSQVGDVAVNTRPGAARLARLRHVVANPPSPRLLLERLRNRARKAGLRDQLGQVSGRRYEGRVHGIEHHLAHLASAFAASPFEQAVAVSVDGFGDFASAAWGLGRGTRLAVEGKIGFPHSLGIFYQAITQYLGFPNYGDEYKVMGLAPYGEPEYVEPLRRVLEVLPDGGYRLGLEYFRHHREALGADWSDGVPRFDALYSAALERLLGPARKPDDPLEPRHFDLARSAQALFEEAYLGLLSALQRRYGVDAVAVAGGCAQNSVANGRIVAKTGFARAYVAAAAYDAGGALGAAYAVTMARGVRPQSLETASFGPGATTPEIDALLDRERRRLDAAGCRVRRLREGELDRRVVEHLIEGGVVGWYQGGMEWGPRALGHRSILADPRRADMKDILNRKIKRRESFRPFAPSVLRERADEWFEGAVDSPFMSFVVPIRPEKRALIPAVTHVDGTGRLQTVDEAHHPRYARLIRAFEARTGVPMLLNTSFNENEPIVCRPAEALDCFLRTKMDALALNGVLIEREHDAT